MDLLGDGNSFLWFNIFSKFWTMGQGWPCSVLPDAQWNCGWPTQNHGYHAWVFIPAVTASTPLSNGTCEKPTLAHSLSKEKLYKKKDNWANPEDTNYKVFFCFLRDLLYPSISRAFLGWKRANVSSVRSRSNEGFAKHWTMIRERNNQPW